MLRVSKKAIKARAIYVQITWVSNYRCPITKSSNRVPVTVDPHVIAADYLANQNYKLYLSINWTVYASCL